MRQYEIAVILDPDLDQVGTSGLTEKIDGWIANLGGTVHHIDQSQKRRLAYPVQKKQEGYYVYWYANLPAEGLRELERDLGITEEVLRFMIIRNDSPPSPLETPEPVVDQLEHEVIAHEAADTSDDEAADTSDDEAADTSDDEAADTSDNEAADTSDDGVVNTA